MPPPSLRYAITDRHLLSPHQPHLTEALASSPPATPNQPSSRPESTRSADAAEKPALSSSKRPLPSKSHPPSNQPSSRPESAQGADSAAKAQPYLPSNTIQSLLQQALRLRDQSVDFLQIREKDLPHHDLLALAQALRGAIPPGSKPRLLLNLGHRTLSPETLLDIARETCLDGLHLPSALPATFAHNARLRFASAGLPPPFLSASVHTPYEVATILPARPDLLLFGPVFGKVVHGTPVAPQAGLPALAEVVRRAHPTPVLALGGLTPENTPAALRTGAAGIASIRLFLPA